MNDEHNKNLFGLITNLDQYSRLTENDKFLINEFCQDLLSGKVQSFSLVYFSGPPNGDQEVKFALSESGQFLETLGAIDLLKDQFKTMFVEDYFGEY